MNRRLKTILTLLVSILLAIALIAYSLSGIDFDQTMDSLRQANYFWIGVSVVLGIMAYWFRSQRWRLLLEPMGYQVTAKRSFIAVCMNYFWNLLIPRSGEIARCTSLYALDKTPVDKSFGTVISERVIDMLCLMFIALMAVVTNIDLIKRLMSEVLITRDKAGDTGSSLKLYIFVGTLTLIIILLYAFRNRIKKLSFYPKIREFIYGIQQGLKTIFQLKRKKEFIVYTLLIWIFYFFMTYVVVFALPETEHLGIADGFYLLLVGGIGMVIPASGGIGAYHSAMRLGFIVLGFSKEVGVTFAFLVHTPHTLIALGLGLISFVLAYFDKKRD
ncbi:lysylphosphatidylglycerol synthase transmembrane domain-containing protein [Ornithobacterium rhinotracheale]|uniref:lysylphosphatidylglycerol synthase transmembrane domain-containing protein n=1 Tax=Ornithobacterium rhinotracheale TaxID=28251 RepID=UPI003FA46EA0